MIDPDVVAAQHLPIAAALICAVTDRDPVEVEKVLTQKGVNLQALAVVLASLVPDDVVIENMPILTLDEMITTTARVLHVDPDEILSPSVARPVVKARQVVCAAAHRSGLSYSDIGRRLKRDHATVMHSVAKVNADAYLSALASMVAGLAQDEVA